MAKENKKEKQEREKSERREAEKKIPRKEEDYETLVRIMGFDIPGSKNIYVGLTWIKGISWAVSNFVCLKLGYPKSKKVGELSKEEIKKIEEFLKEIPLVDYMKNRRFEPDTGESKHIYGVDLDMAKNFDIKKMKQIKSYKGMRHALGQPVRGQKTRSHFRGKGKAVGVAKRKEAKKQ